MVGQHFSKKSFLISAAMAGDKSGPDPEDGAHPRSVNALQSNKRASDDSGDHIYLKCHHLP